MPPASQHLAEFVEPGHSLLTLGLLQVGLERKQSGIFSLSPHLVETGV